jgi:L-threonylcarbamoyladenylate synthase
MERVKVDPEQPDPDTLKRAAELLREGAVVAYPTETFYGLGANAFNEVACERIRGLKGRAADKPLPLIVADVEQLELLCDSIPPSLPGLAERFWPGPLTVVVPVRADLIGKLAEHLTVAVRVSGLPLARELARVAGVPLTATSANPSHQKPPVTADEVEESLSRGLDLLLDGGPTKGGRASTIVDLSGEKPRLLRRGAVAYSEVLERLERNKG